jgi:hypothetical protein
MNVSSRRNRAGKKEHESFAEKINFLRLMGVFHPPLSRKEGEML